MSQGRMLRYLGNTGQRNTLRTSQMLNHPERELLHDVGQQFDILGNFEDMGQRNNRPGQEQPPYVTHSVEDHNFQFRSHVNIARNQDSEDSFLDLHQSHISYEIHYSRQDRAPHVFQSGNPQFLNSDISTRNHNFQDFPNHQHGPISCRTHVNDLQNHRPVSVLDRGGYDAAAASSASASNFHNHHPIPPSNCRSYSAPHLFQSDNPQFLDSDISTRNHNFQDSPNHQHGPISCRTHVNDLQNHRSISVVDLGGYGAAAAASASNFHNHHPIAPSNCRSYPASLNYHSSVAERDHNHLVQQFMDLSFQLSTLNSMYHRLHPSYLDHYRSHQHEPSHSLQSLRGNNFYLPPQIPSSSYRHEIPLPLDTTNPFSDTRNRNFRPSTSQLYQTDLLQPQSNHHFDLLDSVAIVDLANIVIDPNYFGTRSDDEDMMTYESLLSRVPEMGFVSGGLSEETITRHLKTRTHVSSENAVADQVPEICVICQAEYEGNETIGTLQCGHDYHADCIKEWLLRKNECPVCKSRALRVEVHREMSQEGQPLV